MFLRYRDVRWQFSRLWVSTLFLGRAMKNDKKHAGQVPHAPHCSPSYGFAVQVVQNSHRRSLMKTNRRRFLTTLGATASATLLAPSVFDFKLLAGPLFVRPDVSSLSATDPIILGYQSAIANMQALPVTDVRSWSYQAAIHATTTTPVKIAWNTCQHGTHLFWAWHRMYLYWWERMSANIQAIPVGPYLTGIGLRTPTFHPCFG